MEVLRIPLADEQPGVQFRLFQAGTSSWYWGIDSWGLYKIPYTETAQGYLKDYATGSNQPARLALSVSNRELSARLSARTPRSLQPGTDAAAAFPIDLSLAQPALLPTNRLHLLVFSGLDPAKRYEVVLYSDLGTGDGGTGTQLSYSIADTDGFQNGSSRHPTLALVSGSQNQTTVIDITDNSRADRGFVCRFSDVRPGADGDFQISLQSARESCLTALKLVETTPQALALTGPTLITPTSATLTCQLQTEIPASVYICWGRQDGGTAPAKWDHVELLGQFAAGQVSRPLADLETFRSYSYAFYCSNQLGVFWTGTAAFRPQVQGILYATGFEPDERDPFSPGQLHGQDPRGIWRVSQGTAVVQRQTTAHGLQAVQAGECTIEIALTNASDVLWVDGFFMESGSTNPPILPTNILSSVVYFSATQGILALDGDGQGHGQFVQVVPEFAHDQFVRITVRNDYAARTYDLWIDGLLRRAGLGFKDNSVSKFSGAQRRSHHANYLDDFSVSIWGLDRDSDGDGLVDLDEAKFYGSYPLLADSDRDGASDSQELLAGTDPADQDSVFALRIQLDPQQQTEIRIPTITGRQYTLQRRHLQSQGNWEDMPGASNIPGDGQEKVFLETSDGQNYFYRGVIINR